jgi:PE family
MSYVVADSEMMTAAASDLATIGSKVEAPHMVAAARMTSVIPAAATEVSASIAQLFSQFGQDCQAPAAEAPAFEEQFVRALTAGARSYVSAETANVAAFTANPAQTVQQDLLSLINAPSLALTGRPLIGNGANAAPGSGANGGNGGLLWGNGGSGAPGQNGGHGGAGGLLFGVGGAGGAGGTEAQGGVGGVGGSFFGIGGAGGAGGAGTNMGGTGGIGGLGGTLFGIGGTGGAGGLSSANDDGFGGSGGRGGSGGYVFGIGGTGGAGGLSSPNPGSGLLGGRGESGSTGPVAYTELYFAYVLISAALASIGGTNLAPPPFAGRLAKRRTFAAAQGSEVLKICSSSREKLRAAPVIALRSVLAKLRHSEW